MCKLFAPLYSVLSLCNFGHSHVEDQMMRISFLPNFVCSVIINQSHAMTVFRAQTDKKNTWNDYHGKKQEEKRKGSGEEDLTGSKLKKKSLPRLC